MNETARQICRRKVRHDTYLDALIAVSRMRARGDRQVLRVYRCSRCLAFHLTSNPVRWTGRGQWHVGIA